MSAPTASLRGLDRETLTSYRALALASAAALTLSYLSILLRVIDVVGGVGGVGVFVLETLAVIALAGFLARYLTVRRAVGVGFLLLLAGLLGYMATVPGAYVDLTQQVRDTVALLTGLSVLRMTNAGIWALGFVPAPVFVSWYFVLRREYALGVLVGGGALAFFTLTGDAGVLTGLFGAVGAVGAVGFGRLDREGGTAPQRNTIIAVAVAILVVTTSVSLVPGGEAQPLLPNRGGTTVEASLTGADERVEVLGSITLSPKVRFTVTAEEAAYWRVGAYDRYTGDGWVRTGTATEYFGALERPEGSGLRRIRQTYEVESTLDVMPAAWKPVRVGVGVDNTMVTSMAGLKPEDAFEAGDQYSVLSYRNDPSVRELQRAGTSYPDAIEERYLQLPESTPSRVGRFTARLTANASTPYATAVIVERWLERNKRYSLTVDRPDGNIAANFLFDMEAGYCVYFATTMVTMLRSQGIPARFVVGYTPGQQVAENRWVVRGLDSHAWVEVYFPGEGWVKFDPTPSAPRSTAEADRLQQARAADVANVDTDRSRGSTFTPDGAGSTDTPVQRNRAQAEIQQGIGTANVSPVGGIAGPQGARLTANARGRGAGAGDGSPLPDRRTVLYGLILLAGAATAVHRVGLLGRLRREVWLRRAPRGDPQERVEGAFDRVEYLLGRRYRERRADETPREYVETLQAHVDDRIVRLHELYERARYAGRASEEDARAADRLLEELLEDRTVWR